MPLKTQNPQNTRLLWKAESVYSETEIASLAQELATALKAGDRLFLEGPMGVGKSTFARALLLGLGVHQPPEGSPTFAIAHEYEAPLGEVVHIDFYRLKSEMEIEEAGISAYYWERNALVISEWISSWSEFAESVSKTGRTWHVSLSFEEENPSQRRIQIEQSQISKL